MCKVSEVSFFNRKISDAQDIGAKSVQNFHSSRFLSVGRLWGTTQDHAGHQPVTWPSCCHSIGPWKGTWNYTFIDFIEISNKSPGAVPKYTLRNHEL